MVLQRHKQCHARGYGLFSTRERTLADLNTIRIYFEHHVSSVRLKWDYVAAVDIPGKSDLVRFSDGDSLLLETVYRYVKLINVHLILLVFLPVTHGCSFVGQSHPTGKVHCNKATTAWHAAG